VQTIKEKLRGDLKIKELHIMDKSGGCGQCLLAIVVAEDFKDMKLLDRQYKVNQILVNEITKVHAFELKTWTEE
jgi:stress-induced morphogen